MVDFSDMMGNIAGSESGIKSVYLRKYQNGRNINLEKHIY